MPHARKRALDSKVPPGVLVLIIALLMWLVSTFVPTFDFQIPFQPKIVWLFVLFGLVIAGFGVVEFKRAKTTMNPLKPGSSSALVTRGLYQRTRNPMYLGFLLLLVAMAIATANLLAFLFLPVFVLYMNEFQIKPEERALASIFSEEFEKYCSRVRRWI